MDLSIIIVNWNSKDYLKRCLDSIFCLKIDLEFEVIVIDNASYDGTSAMLRANFPCVRFIQSDTNLGFARANNLAARHARAEALLFLNPDTEVRPGAIQALWTALRVNDAAGVIGARLLNTDGTLQTSCIQAFPSVFNEFMDADVLRRLLPRLALWGTSALAETNVAAVQSISGACLLTRRALFVKLGGFSEAFFMYYEDTDYCLQTVRAGYRNLYVPQAVVIHHGGKSSGGRHSKFSSVMMAESGKIHFNLRHGVFVANAFRISLSIKAASRIACLAVLWPIARVRRKSGVISNALRKWVIVFHWTIGGQRWASDYRPASPSQISIATSC